MKGDLLSRRGNKAGNNPQALAEAEMLSEEIPNDLSFEAFVSDPYAEAHNALPRNQVLALDCLGLRWDGQTLVVGAPKESWDEVKALAASLDIKVKLIEASRAEIREALSLTVNIEKSNIGQLQISATEAGEAPISNLVQQIIERAFLERASDIHFESYEDHVLVRARIDGRLRNLLQLPARLAPAISSRIKVLSKMNIVERRRPQDGQFTAVVDGRTLDIRVASVATVFGEKIVLRLLDGRRPSVDLESLGMGAHQLEIFTKMITANNGLVLVAGPTGSGKTTTLHSAIRAVAVEHKNAVTIEDPVEYVVPGITQIPVSESNNSGFAVQLRAVLRQDPDIILVGETRDAETARISVQAALTGHLVFTSIHATDSVGALYRLLQMDIEPHLVASSVRGVVSQRLIRKNCRFCTVKYNATTEEKVTLRAYGFSTDVLAKGVGCTLCGGSGYRDRIAAYQILTMNESLTELVVSRPDPHVFRKAASKAGMTTMDHEAVRMAVAGITTLDEAMTLLVGNE